MRPTPSETISGVRRLLAEITNTCEMDGYARARLSEIDVALGQVEWDDALVQIAAANVAAAELVRSGLDWIDGDPAAHIGVVVNRPQLEEVLAGCKQLETFTCHNDRSAACQAAVVALTAHLHEWIEAHPADQAAAALWERYRAHYSARRRSVSSHT